MAGIHEDLTRSVAHKVGSDRSFGLVMAALFCLVGFGPMVRGEPMRPWAVAVAVGFLVVALVRPGILHRLNVAWMKLALLLSKITNPVIIAAMYYLVIVPIGALMKLGGNDPLRRRFDEKASTYWIERSPPGPDPKQMLNQF